MRRINSHSALSDTQQLASSYQCVVFPYRYSPLCQKEVAGKSKVSWAKGAKLQFWPGDFFHFFSHGSSSLRGESR